MSTAACAGVAFANAGVIVIADFVNFDCVVAPAGMGVWAVVNSPVKEIAGVDSGEGLEVIE